ncbi:hypothetical protein DCAR_0522326 [Daucus carota subsp. sativus]|uniref:Protein phosphatase n=1 Tax=Daucus carota subsp. sativus TaxID=79200 RepID=A0AAF0X6Y1_DAUCS|nr:hypothetical protein DCAR_0522326 [Daucus carota subsp. sativus]
MPSTHLSTLRSAIRQGIKSSSTGAKVSIQDSVEVGVSLGKIIGNSRLLHSLSDSCFSKLNVLLEPGTTVNAQSNLHIVNRRKNISVVGAVPRTFSTPSVSGPSFEVCGYHLDHLFIESGHSSSNIHTQKTPMAISISRALVGDCSVPNVTSKHGHSLRQTSKGSSAYRNLSFDNCRKACMKLSNNEQPNNNSSLYGFFSYHVVKSSGNSYPALGFGLRSFHISAPASFSAGTAPDVSFENPVREEQVANAADSSEQKIIADRSLKLNSGSCYLPHPDKEETGGEDAHFICSDEQAIGVADGVGGWADLGVNAGLYARELMSNSVAAIQDEPKGSIDPSRVLEKAYSSTKARGSSTACIIALTEQGIHAINLGDSGFMVVRDGCTIFRSTAQQHDFNFTYQLENGSDGDLPSSGEVITVPVAAGDVIIAGTDGLFDNLYNNDITAVVVHAVRAGFGPQVTAQKIAALARQRAQDKNRQTPFSSAAQEAGFRYYGGKLDDITVVVSYITNLSKVGCYSIYQ